MKRTAVVCLTIAIAGWSASASAQTMTDVVRFLLTNRTIATDDFTRDQQATLAASDAVSKFLLVDLNTLPVSTSAGGFTYRFDPSLGLHTRSTDSFDPFFTKRALTAGARQVTVGLSYQQSSFGSIDGRPLKNGTLVSSASALKGESEPFDVESVTLRLHAETATLVANAGLTDRFEAGAAVPLVRVTLDGQRIDTYRGHQTIQSTAIAATSGPGDMIFNAKYEVLRERQRGLAVGAQARLPTGSSQNLLGSGRISAGPLLIASYGDERTSVHGNVGYEAGGLSQSLDYSGAAIYAASSHLTVIGELTGHRLADVGRLTQTVAPHPTLANVDTIRLTSTNEAISRIVAVGGVKWNFRSTWLLSASVLRPLTSAGLNASWTPTITLDHSFGQ